MKIVNFLVETYIIWFPMLIMLYVISTEIKNNRNKQIEKSNSESLKEYIAWCHNEVDRQYVIKNKTRQKKQINI